MFGVFLNPDLLNPDLCHLCHLCHLCLGTSCQGISRYFKCPCLHKAFKVNAGGDLLHREQSQRPSAQDEIHMLPLVTEYPVEVSRSLDLQFRALVAALSVFRVFSTSIVSIRFCEEILQRPLMQQEIRKMLREVRRPAVFSYPAAILCRFFHV